MLHEAPLMHEDHTRLALEPVAPRKGPVFCAHPVIQPSSPSPSPPWVAELQVYGHLMQGHNSSNFTTWKTWKLVISWSRIIFLHHWL